MEHMQDTDHSSELVKFWFKVGSPEVDISSFISHLITGRRHNTQQLKSVLISCIHPSILRGDVPVVGC